MNDAEDFKYFQLRKEAKTYISKVFAFSGRNSEPRRHVRMVIEGSDRVHLGEIEGSLCLRLTGNSRKTQVTAMVTQDDRGIRRLTLQTFKSRAGDWIEAFEKDEFTFRPGEFSRLLNFLSQVEFIDLSNQDNFQIEDISKQAGPKAIIDAADLGIFERFKRMSETQRSTVVHSLHDALTKEEINILLGRRQGLEEFEARLIAQDWSEAEWQEFFEREPWVFGYGLDYRIMRQFGREMTVGSGGTDNQNRPIVDFLMSFTDYTVLVEIKRPDTAIFRQTRGGRAGTWEFSSEFMSAVSQILAQRAEWSVFAETGRHFDKEGNPLEARTKNAKSILVIGTRDQFADGSTLRNDNVKRDTFELFRRECRAIDILTFDELFERARFITRSK